MSARERVVAWCVPYLRRSSCTRAQTRSKWPIGTVGVVRDRDSDGECMSRMALSVRLGMQQVLLQG